ncbi:MAG: pseudoazurin [Pseudomonadota bacterium]
MNLINRRQTLILGAGAAAGLAGFAAAPRALAEEVTHTVEMLNVHPENKRLRQVFFPRIQVVAPGESVLFAATDRGHNSASIEEMVPEGAEGWDGKINDEITVTFEQPGFYGYKCTPHASVGMVGLIVVTGEGMMDNLEAAQGVRQRGRAKGAWEEIWEEVAAMDFDAMAAEKEAS